VSNSVTLFGGGEAAAASWFVEWKASLWCSLLWLLAGAIPPRPFPFTRFLRGRTCCWPKEEEPLETILMVEGGGAIVLPLALVGKSSPPSAKWRLEVAEDSYCSLRMIFKGGKWRL